MTAARKYVLRRYSITPGLNTFYVCKFVYHLFLDTICCMRIKVERKTTATMRKRRLSSMALLY